MWTFKSHLNTHQSKSNTDEALDSQPGRQNGQVTPACLSLVSMLAQ
jgi:hypothetical protein